MTTKEYEAYQKRFQSFMDRNGLANLSIQDSEADPYFTWRKCEVCGGLAGERYICNGYVPGKKDIINDIETCPDCVYYAEYGQLDDMTMMDMTD